MNKKIIDNLIATLVTIRKGMIQSLGHMNLSVVKFILLDYLFCQKQTTIKDCALYLGITMASASSLIDSMEKAGFVKRTDNKKDRRVVFVVIENKGKEMIEKSAGCVTNHIFGSLSKQDKENLLKITRKIEKNIVKKI